jgi:hypothetical protein
VFDDWNKGDLDSFLIEITRDIMKFKDSDGKYLLEKIRDTAGQKGTGKWTAIASLEYGVPVTLIGKFCVYVTLIGKFCVPVTLIDKFCVYVTLIGKFCVTVTLIGKFCVYVTLIGKFCVYVTLMFKSFVFFFYIN